MSNLMRATVTPAGSVDYNQSAVKMALFNTDGDPLNVPELVAAQTDVGAVTSTVAAGSTPTKAEFDALRVDALATRTVLNSLLAKLRTAGVVAP